METLNLTELRIREGTVTKEEEDAGKLRRSEIECQRLEEVGCVSYVMGSQLQRLKRYEPLIWTSAKAGNPALLQS